MNKFINQMEAAAFAENAARQEVVTGQNGTVTVYSGTPDLKDPAVAEQGDWEISRTIVQKSNGNIVIETTWAHGSWDDRASLTYKYL